MQEKTTLVNLRSWTHVRRKDIPRYLCDFCPVNLREGRKLKTKMRLGCHELNSSAYRKVKHRTENDKMCICGCGVETIEHVLFDCKYYNEQRLSFEKAVHEVMPSFSGMSRKDKLLFLFKDDTSLKLAFRSYRYFIEIFKLRKQDQKRRLVNLTARGEGLRTQAEH